jgi:hypothetical protein
MDNVIKVGDRVRWIKENMIGLTYGNIYTVIGVRVDDDIMFEDDDGDLRSRRPSDIQKVEDAPAATTRAVPKVGDMVRYLGDDDYDNFYHGQSYRVTRAFPYLAEDAVEIVNLERSVKVIFSHEYEYPVIAPVAPRAVPKVGDMVRSTTSHESEGLEYGVVYRVTGSRSDGVVSVIGGSLCSAHVRLGPDEYEYPVAPPNTLTIRAKVIFYPKTGAYTIYGSHEPGAADLVIADLAHDIEGQGPYVLVDVNVSLPTPTTKIYNVTATPFEGDNYD